MKTVNAILLERNDSLLLDAIRHKRALGWSVERIARFYNIYHGKEIPAKLYKV